jgi:hypothetical protein
MFYHYKSLRNAAIRSAGSQTVWFIELLCILNPKCDFVSFHPFLIMVLSPPVMMWQSIELRVR